MPGAAVAGPPQLYIGYRHPETREPCPPNPKQGIAHASLADEIFFGGAAGPGKSEWVIQDSVKTCIQYPAIEVAVFRRTLKDLEQSLIPRFRDMVPRSIARYHGGLYRAEFSNRSLLWFCYCAKDSDVTNYQSAQWEALYVDEGSHLTGFQHNYLRTRVRARRPNIRIRVAIGSNPGNRGHLYLKKRYVKPGGYELSDRPMPKPMEIWRPHPPPEKPWVVQKTRQFIPARLDDNPWMQVTNPNYISELYMQHGAIALQLAEGDWDANDEMLLGEWRDSYTVKAADERLQALGLHIGQVIPWHVIPRPGWRPPRGAKIFGSVDYGYGAPWSFHLHATLPGGHVRTFFEHYRAGVKDYEQARMIRAALERLTYADGSAIDKPEWIVCDPSMDNSREEHGVQKSIFEVYQEEIGEQLKTLLVKGAAGRNARVSRVQRWKTALATNPDGLPNWTITTACPHAIETVPALNRDDNDPEVEDEDGESHAYEDIGRFFDFRPHFPKPVTPDALAHLDPVSRAHQQRMEARQAPKDRQRFDMRGMAE